MEIDYILQGVEEEMDFLFLKVKYRYKGVVQFESIPIPGGTTDFHALARKCAPTVKLKILDSFMSTEKSGSIGREKEQGELLLEG